MIATLSLSSFLPFDPEDFTIRFIVLKLNFMLVMFLFMYLFYLSFYYFYPRKKLRLAVSLIIALVTPVFVRYFLDQILHFWLFGTTNYNTDRTFHFFYIDNLYFGVHYIAPGILYYFFRRNEVLQQARLEDAKLQSQAAISHLRSQVNPHFLFNSLNNIYSLAYDKSDKILGAIEGLSELLRYALYEKSEFVKFKTEWTNIVQLIKIENMRLLQPVQFDIDISDEVLNVSVPPVIFLPLIENVFKHGDVQDANHPPSIKAVIKDKGLYFRIQNKISDAVQKDNQSGIGLDNIKKRLDHIYENEASFEVLEKDNTFIAQLIIPIK